MKNCPNACKLTHSDIIIPSDISEPRNLKSAIIYNLHDYFQIPPNVYIKYTTSFQIQVSDFKKK